MSIRSKGRGRPVPDAVNIKHTVYELEKLLKLEEKYKPNLLIASLDQQPGEVALSARDGAVHIMRYLKVWFDLPSNVFFTAVSLLDRFLTRMKVQERFLTCVSISCLYLAAETHKSKINICNLLTISQSKCSSKDIKRMGDIIRKKLDLESGEQPITVFNYLNTILRVMEKASLQANIKQVCNRVLQKKILIRRLEVLMSNSLCASERPSMIVLGLIQSEIEKFISTDSKLLRTSEYSMGVLQLIKVVVDLKKISFIETKEFNTCFANMGYILKEYDNHNRIRNATQTSKMRICRTRSILKPSENFYTNLCTICED